MVAQHRGGEAAAAGQCHGQQQLVGQVFVHGGAAVEPVVGLTQRLASHPLRTNARLAEGAEHQAQMLAFDVQQQGVARPLVFR
ncbi:hypothetical protein D3C78_1413920 [compost metagenome]